MKTRHSHISEVDIARGIPKSVEKPLRPERFEKIQIGYLSKMLGVTQFGVNHIVLQRDVFTSLRHWHEGEDEFVYVLSGNPTLIDNNGERELKKGCFVSFLAGEPNAHHFTNCNDEEAVILVIGSSKPGQDVCHYPDDPLGPIQRWRVWNLSCCLSHLLRSFGRIALGFAI